MTIQGMKHLYKVKNNSWDIIKHMGVGDIYLPTEDIEVDDKTFNLCLEKISYMPADLTGWSEPVALENIYIQITTSPFEIIFHYKGETDE